MFLGQAEGVVLDLLCASGQVACCPFEDLASSTTLSSSQRAPEVQGLSSESFPEGSDHSGCPVYMGYPALVG